MLYDLTIIALRDINNNNNNTQYDVSMNNILFDTIPTLNYIMCNIIIALKLAEILLKT